MGYFAQHQMEQLTADRTVLEELVAHSPATNLGTLRTLAGAFGFHGDDHDEYVATTGREAPACGSSSPDGGP